jgi:hypothetical protein
MGRAALRMSRAQLPVRRDAVRIRRAPRDRRSDALRTRSASLPLRRARPRLRRDARRHRSDAMPTYVRCSTKGEGSPTSSSGIAPRNESEGTHA